MFRRGCRNGQVSPIFGEIFQRLAAVLRAVVEGAGAGMPGMGRHAFNEGTPSSDTLSRAGCQFTDSKHRGGCFRHSARYAVQNMATDKDRFILMPAGFRRSRPSAYAAAGLISAPTGFRRKPE